MCPVDTFGRMLHSCQRTGLGFPVQWWGPLGVAPVTQRCQTAGCGASMCYQPSQQASGAGSCVAGSVAMDLQLPAICFQLVILVAGWVLVRNVKNIHARVLTLSSSVALAVLLWSLSLIGDSVKSVQGCANAGDSPCTVVAGVSPFAVNIPSSCTGCSWNQCTTGSGPSQTCSAGLALHADAPVRMFVSCVLAAISTIVLAKLNARMARGTGEEASS